MVLTEFCTMILCAVLHIHTNNLNITTNNTTPDRVVCWLNHNKQFNPDIHFIPGKDNVIADTLSWLDCLEESILLKDKQVFVLKDSVSKGTDVADNPLLIECFLHLPPLEVLDTNPIDYQWIITKKWNWWISQTMSKISRQVLQQSTEWQRKYLLCGTQWQPQYRMEIWLNWLHDLTYLTLVPCQIGHPDSCHIRMLQAQYHHPHLWIIIKQFACNKCQCSKPSCPSHGLLPDWDIAVDPWEEVAVDLIGSWPASTPQGTVEFFALTCIDNATNLVEIARIFKKSREPGSLGTLSHYKSSMTMGKSLQVLLSNSCYVW